MKIVGIIPARGGSKGVPRKNIKILGGKPLISYTIEAALHSKLIDKVIVSTEDSEIAEVSKAFGAEIVQRPMELAQDETKTAPVIVHTVKKLQEIGYMPDIIVLLQPTSPFRDEKIIDAALNQLINSGYDSIFTGIHTGYPLGLWLKSSSENKTTALYNYHLRPRRQELLTLDKLIVENGAMYAIKYPAFVETSDFLGNNPDAYITERLIDIDTPDDFKEAEKYLEQKALNPVGLISLQ